MTIHKCRLLGTALLLGTLLTGASQALAEAVLHRGNAGEPQTLDYAHISIDIEGFVVRDMFEGLTIFDANGKIIPGTAESWTVSEDETVYTFKIRDKETAELAIHASLTGHLVFSTLHTNDAPSAVIRLIELGVPAYLINATLLGVLAQRLVRRLCLHCRRVDERGQWHPVGCEHCLQSGYKGRTGVYELMVADGEPRFHATQRATQLVLGLRSSEVLSRRVRDVDNEGRELWIDEGKTKVGYEIPFTCHFYRYTPLRPLAEARRRSSGRCRPAIQFASHSPGNIIWPGVAS